MKLAVPLFVALAMLAACAKQPVAAVASGSAIGAMARGPQNPVLDQDFPDPMVLKASDGRFYAYATGSTDGGPARHVSVSSSTDLVHWTPAQEALPAKPAWAHAKNNFWAPHVVQAGNRYLMYLSVEPDWSESEHLRLAIATADRPEGPFTDVGKEMDTGDAEENLDPMAFQDPQGGKRYMYWGRNGVITVQELAADGLAFAPGSASKSVLEADPKRPFEGIAEGPYVHFHGGWYYLYYSGDDCCVQAHYAVMVARSRSPLGHFEKLADARKRPDSVILSGAGRWKGPGHNAVLTVGRDDWMIYHAVDTLKPTIPGSGNVRRPLMVDKITYQDGWPRVNDGHPH